VRRTRERGEKLFNFSFKFIVRLLFPTYKSEASEAGGKEGAEGEGARIMNLFPLNQFIDQASYIDEKFQPKWECWGERFLQIVSLLGIKTVIKSWKNFQQAHEMKNFFNARVSVV
jgi:hypothetical protein